MRLEDNSNIERLEDKTTKVTILKWMKEQFWAIMLIIIGWSMLDDTTIIGLIIISVAIIAITIRIYKWLKSNN